MDSLDFLKPRHLGIDYGESRIGLAISDELGMLAHPLETIHCRVKHSIDRIEAVVPAREVRVLVLGLPLIWMLARGIKTLHPVKTFTWRGVTIQMQIRGKNRASTKRFPEAIGAYQK